MSYEPVKRMKEKHLEPHLKKDLGNKLKTGFTTVKSAANKGMVSAREAAEKHNRSMLAMRKKELERLKYQEEKLRYEEKIFKIKERMRKKKKRQARSMFSGSSYFS